MKTIEETVKDIKNEKSSKEELYEKIKGFINFQEQKFFLYTRSGAVDKEELLSLVWLGIENAISTYSPQKDCKFLTWAAHCIRFEVLAEVKKHKRREVSLDACIDEEGEGSLYEAIPDPSSQEDFEQAETGIDGGRVLGALKQLSREEQRVINLTCIKNISLAQCAREMNISVGHARSVRLRALKKLKRIIA